jgi:hypothetical protein
MSPVFDGPVQLDTPAKIVAAIPDLVGFVPTNSVVLLHMNDTHARLTVRLDAPSSPDEFHVVPHAIDLSRKHAESTSVIAVLYDLQGPAIHQGGSVSSAPLSLAQNLAAVIAEHCEQIGLPLTDLLLVREGKWFSVACQDPQCCPSEGTPIPDWKRDETRASFVLHGSSPASSRSEIEQHYEPLIVDHPEVVELNVAIVSQLRSNMAPAVWAYDLEAKRSHVATAEKVLTGQGTVSQQAQAVIALQSVGVRDAVLLRLSKRHDLREVEDRARALAVRTGPGLRAVLFTLCASLSWHAGSGAKARIALGHALADDAQYNLAKLLLAAIDRGIPPEIWVASITAVTEDECLTT